MKNNWAIIDDESVIYTGTEQEMSEIFYEVQNGELYLEWTGDLLLIEIHGRHR